jgi:hypothetical protein
MEGESARDREQKREFVVFKAQKWLSNAIFEGCSEAGPSLGSDMAPPPPQGGRHRWAWDGRACGPRRPSASSPPAPPLALPARQEPSLVRCECALWVGWFDQVGGDNISVNITDMSLDQPPRSASRSPGQASGVRVSESESESEE